MKAYYYQAFSKSLGSEKGEGSTGIFIYAGLFSVVWLVGSFIIGFIYDTKEARVARSQSANALLNGPVKFREPGGYQVNYRNELFSRTMKVEDYHQ